MSNPESSNSTTPESATSESSKSESAASEAPAADSAGGARPSRGRWMRWGTRSLLVVMTIIAVLVAYVSHRARTQRQAVERVAKLGGMLAYDYQFDPDLKWKDPDLQDHHWFVDVIGEDFVRSVWIINFDEGSDPTNEDLAVLKQFRDLKQLTLMNRKRISDDGLVHLSGLSKLEVLALSGTNIQGQGLVHLRECRQLEGLPMNGAPITDAGLKHVANLKSLKWLQLSDTKITDQGMVYLAGLDKLENLELRKTAVTDEGLKQLAQLKSLKSLLLGGTQTTKEGRKWLQAQLPNCKVN